MAKSSKEEVDVENLGTWPLFVHDGCEEACVAERAQCRARENSAEGCVHQSRREGWTMWPSGNAEYGQVSERHGEAMQGQREGPLRNH